MLRSLVSESVAASRSQPVALGLSTSIVAAMCIFVLLTTGRSLGVREDILRSVDDVGSRTVTVTAEPDAGLMSDSTELFAELNLVSWVGGFGPAEDVENALSVGGNLVPMRKLWTADMQALDLPSTLEQSNESVYGSRVALEQLGLADGVGSVFDSSGRGYYVVGTVATPDHLSFLDPLMVNPQAVEQPGSLAVLVIVAKQPTDVANLEAIIPRLIDVEDKSKLTIRSSSSIAELRGAISRQVDTFSVALIGGVLLISTTLVGAVMGSLILLRRRDFGRRRALGATRFWIVSLVMLQGFWASLAGSGIGVLIALATLVVTRSPLPPPDAIAAVVILGVGMGTLGSLIPGLAASLRQPLRELRVP